jgi:hypothetical protein
MMAAKPNKQAKVDVLDDDDDDDEDDDHYNFIRIFKPHCAMWGFKAESGREMLAFEYCTTSGLCHDNETNEITFDVQGCTLTIMEEWPKELYKEAYSKGGFTKEELKDPDVLCMIAAKNDMIKKICVTADDKLVSEFHFALPFEVIATKNP